MLCHLHSKSHKVGWNKMSACRQFETTWRISSMLKDHVLKEKFRGRSYSRPLREGRRGAAAARPQGVDERCGPDPMAGGQATSRWRGAGGTGLQEFTVYMYVDWSITVPLQRFEFNLILKAADLVLDRIQKLSKTCTWPPGVHGVHVR